MNANTGRIQSLDGFRAISILMVIISHLTTTHALPTPLNNVLGTLINGKTGVQIFFVISGFLITFFLIREWESTSRINFQKFYIRRILRIIPAFYTYLIVLFVVDKLLNLDIGPTAFLSAALFIHNYTPWETSWFVSHTWSLSVEEQFYLIWPVLFLVAVRYGKPWHWVASLIIGNIARSFYYKFPEDSKYLLVNFFMYSDLLFSGCFMAFLLFYKQRFILSIINHRYSPLLMYFGIVLIIAVPALEYDPKLDILLIPTSGTILGLSICYLILYFTHRDQSIGYQVLNARPMVFVGKISYSIYLWQQLFIGGHWLFGHPWLNIISLLLTSIVSYYFIELPCLRLKEKFQTVTRFLGAADKDGVDRST